jgi:hypothetical protein
MANDVRRIEIAAKAICRSKGRNPEDRISYGFVTEMAQRIGFPGLDPYKDGVWVCEIEEAAKIVAVIDALKADS